MISRVFSHRHFIRSAIPVLLGALTLTGCNSEVGSDDYSQEFEKPAVAPQTNDAGEAPKSRRDEIKEDRERPAAPKRR